MAPEPGLGYVFASACGYGCSDMDVHSFRDLCEQCGLLDERFTASEVETAFSEALPAEHCSDLQRLDLQGFEAALELLAEQRGVGIEEVLTAVLGAGGPRRHRLSTDSSAWEAASPSQSWQAAALPCANEDPPAARGDTGTEAERGNCSLLGESCRCGAAWTEDSRFCRRCGAERGAAAPEGEAPHQSEAQLKSVRSSPALTPLSDYREPLRSRSNCPPREGAKARRATAREAPRLARERPQTPRLVSGPTPARAEVRRRTVVPVLTAEGGGGARQAEDGLDEAFRAFCGPGQSGMDGKTFAKLCRDGRLLDRAFTATDADLVFAKVAPKGRRRLGPREFREALLLLAEKKGADAAATLAAVAALRGPALRGTKAEAVRFHDDKSTYTGTHAKGGPEAVPLGRGSATQLAALGMRMGHRR